MEILSTIGSLFAKSTLIFVAIQVIQLIEASLQLHWMTQVIISLSLPVFISEFRKFFAPTKSVRVVETEEILDIDLSMDHFHKDLLVGDISIELVCNKLGRKVIKR